MRAALKHHRDRVREIAFEGSSASFDKFFRVTNCPFPALESLVLNFRYSDEPIVPDTFLRGPDLSGLHLRRLTLRCVSFVASIFGLLLSAPSLTDLYWVVYSAVDPSSLLSCLQGMHSLRSLELYMPASPPSLEFLSRPPTPKEIVSLSKLTRLHYAGTTEFMDALVAGLSAPSLQDVKIRLGDTTWPPVAHIPRFINEIEEHYYAVHVAFRERVYLEETFSFSLLSQSEYIGHCKPRFELCSYPSQFPESIIRISGALSTRLTTAEKLRFTFSWKAAYDDFPWRRFYRQFPGVRTLLTEGANSNSIARTLLQGREEPDDDLTFLPALEEIEIGKQPSSTHERQTRSRLAAFQPFVSARQRAGRPVKVFFSL
jgi:hypothetical protein